jgi:hypothetical protein
MSLSARKAAQNFLRDQIRIMEKYGKAPKLDAAQKGEIINKVQAYFESLRGTTARPTRKSA